MKRRNIICNLFLIILCMSICTPVFATEIFINPETPGSITIHKLAVDNLEEYIDPANGLEADVSGFDILSGITFTVTRVLDDTDNPENAEAYQGEGSYQESIATDIDNGEAIFKELPHGVYLVHEEESPAVSAAVDDFLVNIPMTNHLGTGFIYDVHVYPKNQLISLPDFGMYIDKPETLYASTSLEDNVPWYITAEVPKDIGSAILYKVSSTINPFLEYIDGSINLSVEEAGGDIVPLTINDDYIFTSLDGQLDIEINDEGKRILNNALSDGFVPVLTIAYQTKLNINAGNFQQASGVPLSNETNFHYTNALNVPYMASLPEERVPYVYSGGINISKVDRRNETTTLQGAAFNLYTSLADANSGNNPVLDPNGEDIWTVSTNADGKAYFYGLSYGEPGLEYNNTSATYYLVEIQAPEGYNLVGAPIEATVDAASHLENNPVMVRDSAGFLLPVTGGMGTVLFTVIGLGLIAIACYMIYRSSAERKKKD